MIAKGLKFGLALAIAGLLTHTPVSATDIVVAGIDTTTAGTSKKAKLIDLWQPGDSGQRMNIRGRVTSPDGTPIAGIGIKIRQPDGHGEWSAQYRTTLTTDAKGRYQFGSVVPKSKYCGAPHVQVTIIEDGWDYFDKNLLFAKNLEPGSHNEDGIAVFLEESTVNDETILYGRYDIVLTPK